MTRKDYLKITAELNRYRLTSNNPDYWEWLTKEMALMLQQDNPQFNMTKFLTACGLQEE